MFFKTGGRVTPNLTLFLKEEKKVFQGPHRTILGHPKHVLHLVPSIKFIVKDLNVIFNEFENLLLPAKVASKVRSSTMMAAAIFFAIC